MMESFCVVRLSSNSSCRECEDTPVVSSLTESAQVPRFHGGKIAENSVGGQSSPWIVGAVGAGGTARSSICGSAINANVAGCPVWKSQAPQREQCLACRLIGFPDRSVQLR